jgi:hypothetical protein
MKLSELQFTAVKPKNGLIGFVSFVYNDEIYFSSIAVFTKKDGSGYSLSYPGKSIGSKTIHYYHPINKAIGHTILDEVSAFLTNLLSTEGES